MSALPRKHPTGRQKLRKSNRVYPRYDDREEELRKRKSRFGRIGRPNWGQASKAQPQRGWNAQHAQNQRPPISKWWWIAIIIVVIVFVVIISSTLNNLNNLSQEPNNGNDNSENSGNDCTCYCGDGVTRCTSNSQCPEDPPGVPGVCGCPVNC